MTFNSSGTISSAYFIPRTKFDYGTLLCRGKNSIGEQRRPCVFTIIPAGKPESVSNCTINNQTERSLNLACEAGDDGGLLQQFHLEIYSRKYQILLVNMTSLDHPVFEAVGLPSGSPLRIVVYASNAKGKSSKVTLTATTLFTAEKHIGETPLTDTEDKSDQHKMKNPEDRSETKDRCPDVIPPRNVPSGPEYTDIALNVTTKPTDLASQCTYENLNKQREHTYENIISKPQYTSKKNNEELTYAELILPENKTNTVRKSVDPPTEYADIDFHKSSKLASSPGNETEEEEEGFSVETPLMNNRKDDKKWLQMEREKPTVSTPV
ncbi:uncharacterized protein LOC111085889 isoform X2 [Limulus polyphemus]|uniref:Uncharacterized protein LOC111085889 isoform X2 n=1 Tax=Limulus polyphemus TaxID=6850 RepID=A0ABM1SFE8_LIMPO|nr:uncharacterized protein LOC111085889 isoform X2 [Limulus polyphemus]